LVLAFTAIGNATRNTKNSTKIFALIFPTSLSI
jgi:hypothetical protein